MGAPREDGEGDKNKKRKEAIRSLAWNSNNENKKIEKRNTEREREEGNAEKLREKSGQRISPGKNTEGEGVQR